MRKIKKIILMLLVLSILTSLCVIPASAATNGWKKVDGIWYYYTNGVKKTGWVKDAGKWYYMNASGEMQTGWEKVSGKWYYMSGSGAMQTGWIKVSGKWYYLNGSGAMQTGWVKVSGKWYYLNGSGAMQTGFQDIGGETYYLASSGAMATGWQKLDGEWYYFNGSGAMQTGWLTTGSTQYYLYSDGTMATGSVRIDGKAYYFSDSGAYVPRNNSAGYSEDALEIIDRINEYRKSVDSSLCTLSPSGSTMKRAADIRAEEASINWAHVRPNGTMCYTVVWDVGLSTSDFYTFDENLYYTTLKDPLRAVNAWINSDGHRANLLDPDVDTIAIGIAYVGSRVYVEAILYS